MAIAPLSKEDVLASFEKQFIDSAWHVEMFYNTTGERLTAILQDAGDTQRFAKARELMQTTLTEYRDALGKVAVEHFQQLARVAIAQPKWITGDPPHWARSYVERLITQELEPVGVMSLVDCWFRWFCDGPPKFGVDCGKPGWREPWTAPDWADNLERNPAGDYLADKRTAVLLRRERFGFSKRIEYLLDQAEHSARIELAASAPHTSVTEQMPEPVAPNAHTAPAPPAGAHMLQADALLDELRFIRRGNKTMAEGSGNLRPLVYGAYKKLLPEIVQVKSVVRSKKGITIGELRQTFRKTELYKAADDEDWQILIDEFSNERPTELKNRQGGHVKRSAGDGNLAIALLARKTGLKNSAVKTYVQPSKQGRKGRKR